MKLTEIQDAYYPAIKWLLGDQKHSGRTVLLAYAFVEKAYNNPKEIIYPFDHHVFETSTHFDEIMKYIQLITKENYPDAKWIFTAKWFRRES